MTSITPRMAAITGTMTTRSVDSFTFSRSAMITPPTAIIGALTKIVRAICRKSWICWTSLVLRVISVGVPNRFISREEKLCTCSNTARADIPTDPHRSP